MNKPLRRFGRLRAATQASGFTAVPAALELVERVRHVAATGTIQPASAEYLAGKPCLRAT